MVTDTELYNALKAVKITDNRKWNGKRMTKRDGATTGIHRKNLAHRNGPCESGVFGMTANPQSSWKPRPSKLTNDYPEVYKVIEQYMKERLPDFVYESVTVNHNLRCRKHKDSRNSTFSLITSVGDFTGGELNIQHPDTGEKQTFDTRGRWVLYDGSKFEHWNNPIQGDKYSLVFYSRWSSSGKDQKKNILEKLAGGSEKFRLLEPGYLSTILD